jgi:hypothetical protein
MQFAVAVVAPQGFVHSQAFREIAEGLHHALVELGHDMLLGPPRTLLGAVRTAFSGPIAWAAAN